MPKETAHGIIPAFALARGEVAERLKAAVSKTARAQALVGSERVRKLEAYARERLGMSPRKAHALRRLERVGDRCPELREAWRDGRLW